MPSIFQNKRVLILIGGFVLAAVLLLIFAAGGSEPGVSGGPVSPYLSVAPAAPSSAALGDDLLTALALLQTISLDVSVFTDPVFESLSDWGKAIPPQPAGRRNPFAPLGAPTPASQPASVPSIPPKPPASQTSGAGAAVPPASAAPLENDESVWDFSDIDFAL